MENEKNFNLHKAKCQNQRLKENTLLIDDIEKTGRIVWSVPSISHLAALKKQSIPSVGARTEPFRSKEEVLNHETGQEIQLAVPMKAYSLKKKNKRNLSCSSFKYIWNKKKSNLKIKKWSILLTMNFSNMKKN